MSQQRLTYGTHWPLIAKAWDEMAVKKDRIAEVEREAQKLLAHKDRYVGVEQQTGVPWYMIAALHLREASGNFDTYLGNGERLDRVTRLVPKGRGPFANWEEGAADALKLQGFDRIQDWRLEKILYQSMLFNGMGYYQRNLPSPYVWGATNKQKVGKFVADGKFSSTTWDKQIGVAALIKTMAALDPSIELKRES